MKSEEDFSLSNFGHSKIMEYVLPEVKFSLTNLPCSGIWLSIESESTNLQNTSAMSL
jgi:hypothetical protein